MTRATPLDASDPRIIALLADAYPAVATFARALAEDGVTRGLLGPREVPRLWERHLLNSAAVASLLPATGTLIDVGSGAGLPGVVLAAMCPSLRVVLLEPMERRVVWLEHVRLMTGLTNLEVLRGRAEDMTDALRAEVVTARAVAPMHRLAGWTLPLLVRGGVLLALKGRAAAQELESAAGELERFGGDAGEVLSLSAIPGVEPTTVVRVVRTEVRGGHLGQSHDAPTRAASRGRQRSGAGRVERSTGTARSTVRADGTRKRRPGGDTPSGRLPVA